MRFILAALATAALCACGGGGDGGDGDGLPVGTPSQAEGVYVGTLTAPEAGTIDFEMLVLENGEYWAMYGLNSGSQFIVGAFAQGTGASSGTSFSSGDLRVFSFMPTASGTLSATYTSTSLSGSVAIDGEIATINGSRPSSSTYDYNAAARLDAVTGYWALNAINGATASLNVGATGNISGASYGCNYSGTMTPRPSGKNVFNVSITLGSGCTEAGTIYRGIALTYLLPNAQRQLVIAGTDTSRSLGTGLFGVR